MLFYWKYDYGSHSQTAYQINIYKDKEQLYSTGKVISAEQNNIAISLPLQEQTKYHYRISAWDEEDKVESSEYFSFITGVKSWKGFWIGNNTKKPMIVRKKFIYSGKPYSDDF